MEQEALITQLTETVSTMQAGAEALTENERLAYFDKINTLIVRNIQLQNQADKAEDIASLWKADKTFRKNSLYKGKNISVLMSWLQ